ncbi:type IV pili twitching motility protein PilT [bacterium (Candidatus Gribaldobacteria) CG10_big_fil_rev_8_21_14_0_10_37_21]|uniref:Type IV pili twitching motility protein PilT n=1 Tax=bacterium (Candidatus Gribaldobacteria) CG10_big_fil_rev_8_21_14_0_10_37_21 TaxID=2014275 RepID=A0A2H0UUV8_9BACT|nr:MAG: type IV pili twitching motility protein PilT [Parcubacteria group bacterium CG1_02_37_13]PIR90598.1 MAG: type IV pili twitching motility protein PilT [bacterium (Candidatus Gribaldobacteria) CG10_big_fil_rev_8_21_14_0_10_37_21]
MLNAKQIKLLFEVAVEKGASDIHLTESRGPILRISADLIELKEFGKLSEEDTKLVALGLMNEVNKSKFEKDKEVDFAYDFEQKARFRVNVFWQRQKIALALRLISPKIRTLEELNLPPVFKRFTEAKQGLVLITGASSQGKSTTLASLLDSINHQRKEHIVTIEDPIEYIFEDDLSIIQQREVHQDTLSFANALRSVLREDPNVIMVGEMRDLETISTAITAAETGHLVFATLHTNSASQTIHRIIDVFPPHQQGQIKAQTASALLGVVSQRLLPTKGGGFMPACEIMLASPAVRNLIRENRIHEIPAIVETSSKEGMISMNQYLVKLVKEGLVTKETALFYSLSPDDLLPRLGR